MEKIMSSQQREAILKYAKTFVEEGIDPKKFKAVDEEEYKLFLDAYIEETERRNAIEEVENPEQHIGMGMAA